MTPGSSLLLAQTDEERSGRVIHRGGAIDSTYTSESEGAMTRNGPSTLPERSRFRSKVFMCKAFTSCSPVGLVRCLKSCGMSIKTVGQQLRQLRKRKGFSQRELSHLTGISQGQICKMECDCAHPSERVWLLLDAHLGLSRARPPERLALPCASTAFRGPRSRPRVSRAGEVSFEARFYRARKVFGMLADVSLGKIRARQDAPLALRFLTTTRLDSAYEAMFWMLLLAEGGTPCRYALLKAGFRHHRAVDDRRNTVGDMRQPCLQLGQSVLLFPQVSLDVRKAYYRLDVLALVVRRGQRLWVNIEIDGSGHAGDLDALRQADLGLPTFRLGKSRLVQIGLVEWLLAQLLAHLEGARLPRGARNVPASS